MIKHIDICKRRLSRKAQELRKQAEYFDEVIDYAPSDFLVWWDANVDLFDDELELKENGNE